MPSTKEEIDSDSSFSSDSDEELGSTGLTQNQNRLLYLISLYTHLARTDDEKETWIRKPALMVLIYNAIVKKTLDYDYAPASKLVEGRRKYFNISQEGRSDVDYLREEELINGLKLSSKDFQPVVQIDSSKIVDSVISQYQRDLLNLIFMGDAPNRNKINLILCNEITPHLTAEEYMDKGEYENELKQVCPIHFSRTRYIFSTHTHTHTQLGSWRYSFCV